MLETIVLKPQDVLVALKVATLPTCEWTYVSLAGSLFLSPGEVHNAMQRANAAGIMNLTKRTVSRRALEEFLVHGVKYAFPPRRGELTRGMATSYAVSPLCKVIQHALHEIPVWPVLMGDARGYEFSPLYRSAPRAAALDPKLYELLALVDSIRDGRARESQIAVNELKQRLGNGGGESR